MAKYVTFRTVPEYVPAWKGIAVLDMTRANEHQVLDTSALQTSSPSLLAGMLKGGTSGRQMAISLSTEEKE